MAEPDNKLAIVLGNAKNAIQEIDDISELLKVRASAGGYEEAWKKYYQTSGFGFEQMFAGWEVKVRSEKRMGEMLEGMDLAKGGEQYHSTGNSVQPVVDKLEDLGITKTQSHRYQQLSQIDDDKFDKKIEELRGSFREPTTKEVISLYRNIQKQNKPIIVPEDIKSEIKQGDFRELIKELPDNSVDLVLTDPPYPKEFLHLFCDLARESARVLKPGGFLVSYSGHFNLPQIYEMFGEYLEYYWTIALYHKGPTGISWPVNMYNRWKPILIYQKLPKKMQETRIEDVIESPVRDKTMHEWGQSVEPFVKLIETFSKPDDIVVDPFMGAGVVAEACAKTKRNFKGYEIDKKYFDIVADRIAGEK